MSIAIQIDLLVYSLAISLLLILYIFKNYSLTRISTRLFFRILVATSLVTLIEMFTWVVEGIDTPFAYYANWVSNSTVAALEYMPGFFWLLYTDYKVIGEYEQTRKRAAIYLIPEGFLIALVLISFKTGYFFTVLPGSIYQRGPGIYVATLIHYFQYIIAIYLVIRHRRNVNMELMMTILAYFFLPIIATAFQIMFFGTTLIWPTYTLINLIAFTLLEKDAILRAPLTGVHTRGTFEQKIFQLIKRKRAFALIMIDLDRFKYINDTFGHQAGDTALMELVELISRVKRKSDILCRYGGDEFMILIRSGEKDAGKNLKSRIQQALDLRNAEPDLPYPLLMSAGVFQARKNTEQTLHGVLEKVDQEMYREKTLHRETYQR